MPAPASLGTTVRTRATAPASGAFEPLPYTRLVGSDGAGQPERGSVSERRRGGPWAYQDRPAAAKPATPDEDEDELDGVRGLSADGPEDLASAPADHRAWCIPSAE
eukprot:6113675-Alexandrium_andersonii.AAC.1